jgi:hypothetical protein
MLPNAVESTRAMQYRYSQSSILLGPGPQPYDNLLSTTGASTCFQESFASRSRGPEVPNAITMQNETTE